MLSKFLIAALLLLVGVISGSAECGIVTQWTFETAVISTAGPHSAETGTGSALGSHAGATTYSSPVGNGSSKSFSSNGWAIGDFYQFTTSTTGASDIGLTFDHISSSTGPRDFDLSFRVGGSGSFTSAGTYVAITNAAPNAWSSGTPSSASSYSFNLSGIATLNNAAIVDFRLTDTSTTSSSGGTVATTGTSRIDNFTVFSAVPEPTSIALVSLTGCTGLVVVYRRRKSKSIVI